MASKSEAKILLHLSQFPASLNKAWDVPRDASLPGISDALGVVRSALNQPLTKLVESDLISMRKAHVIDGGSRKRQVYHITDSGRIELEKMLQQGMLDGLEKKSSKPVRGSLSGTYPVYRDIVGRAELISKGLEQIESESLLISGLPGIGKTALTRKLADELAEAGKSVYWAQCTEFSDVSTLCEQWDEESTLISDSKALATMFSKRENSVYIVDDIHELHSRHHVSVEQFIRQIMDSKDARVILVGREPNPFSDGLSRLAVPSLAFEQAATLLDEQLPSEERLLVAKRLGGHPLALELWSDGSQLPEQDADIQTYVEDVVLAGLDDGQRVQLDELVILPMPVSADHSPQPQAIGLFDEYALLRWTSDRKRMEVQHLIRNVRRSLLSQERLNELHQQAVEHWSQVAQSNDEKVALLYHRIASHDEELKQHFQYEVEGLLNTHHQAIAVLLEEAIKVLPDDSDLHFMAANVALARGEDDVVEQHLEHLIDDDRGGEVALSLALMRGENEEANALIEEGIAHAGELEASRLALAGASRILDDRISGPLSSSAISEVKKLISAVKIPHDNLAARSAILISLSLIKHAIALSENNSQAASEIREMLGGISGIDHGLISALEVKADFAFLCTNDVSQRIHDSAIKAIDLQRSDLHRDSLRMSLVEILLQNGNSEDAQGIFSQITKPSRAFGKIRAQQRLDARWWQAKAQLNPREAPTCIREAIAINRRCGCTNAAKQLTEMMYKIL